MKARDPYYSN